MKVRRIYLESVEETSWCSDRVRPLKDNFISEKIERYKLNGNYFRTPTDSSARLVTDLSVTNRRSWGY